VNTTLTLLDLRSNNIGNEGVKSLSDTLKVNTTLATLCLSSDNIDDEGIKSLSDALKVNTTLTTLVFDHDIDSIGYEGARLLSKIESEVKINQGLLTNSPVSSALCPQPCAHSP